MGVDTYVERARTRVRTEREALDAKRAAFEQFNRRVRSVSTDPTPAASTSATAVTGTERRVRSADDARCRDVRQAFEETVRPHSLDDVEGSGDESLLETVRSELTESIALALSPATDASFSPQLKRTVVAETTARRNEVVALEAALSREAAHLSDAADAVDAVTERIVDLDETPLTALGFEALEARHETLDELRSRCADLARRRQEFLTGTTNNGVEAGVSHRQLPPYLYRDFPVDHPVLSTVATLEATCDDCQRTVRRHLVRRV
ncbi:hypothetical protein [Halorubrum sp. Atlit-28R]|uniref:DUF7260 family protein n=1 Tax=Halorubrum sp. Atlit-28R TaxID=2282129 RepID=UPI000EF25624|nr:hypothetical protein [Halorubrum sp. Atlit-28R]RLM52534.1 hypothetical protein DVK06_03290 [Halorubrum sp. Atlit-28R]